MSALFTRAARPVILAASRSHRLRHTAERMPLARNVVRRFVPGETVADALGAVTALRDTDRLVSIDYLGEDVTDTDAADATVRAYLRLLDAFGVRSDSGAVKPLEVSLKLSALGQALPKDGEKIALENAHAICERAHQVGAWVTVDAEDHTTTDSTLSIVRGTAYRVRVAGNGSAGLPQAHRGRLCRVRRLRCPDSAVQGRLRRTGRGSLPRSGPGHRILPALPESPDGRQWLSDGRLA